MVDAIELDPTVRRTIENARVSSRVRELQRAVHEQPIAELSDGLKGQLEALGIPMGEGAAQAGVTSTSFTVKLWNRDTGEASNIRFDELEAHMLVRFDSSHATMAGQQVWTDVPLEPKTRGVMKCPLNQAHPDRAAMDALGMAHVSCRKANLVTDIDVEKHIEHRHPSLHARLKRKREDDMHKMQMTMMERQTEILQLLANQQAPKTKKADKTEPDE